MKNPTHQQRNGGGHKKEDGDARVDAKKVCADSGARKVGIGEMGGRQKQSRKIDLTSTRQFHTRFTGLSHSSAFREQ